LKIDEKTGLVQLPEDLFWRVEEDNRKADVYDNRRELKGLKLALVRKTTTTVPGEEITTTEQVERTGFWNRLFHGPYETKTVVTKGEDKEEPDEDVIYTKSSFETYSTKEDYSDHKVREGFSYWHQDTWSNRLYYIKQLPTSAETLTKLSEEIFSLWIDREHGRALAEDAARYRDSFVGDYPPKSLVGASA